MAARLLGDAPMSNAERQARWQERHARKLQRKAPRRGVGFRPREHRRPGVVRADLGRLLCRQRQDAVTSPCTIGPLKAERHRLLGICGGVGALMPSDPHQCRIFAARCLALAKRASRPDARQVFTDMAETWSRLAAETEAAQALFRTVFEKELSGSYDALPDTMKLRFGEYV